MIQKFSLISLGCPKNLVDSEKITANLINSDLKIVSEEESPDLLIINTCAFIGSAVEEAKSIIKEISYRKNKGEIKFIIVTGCLVNRFKTEDLAQEFPLVDLWLNIKEETIILQKIKNWLNNKKEKNKKQLLPRLTSPNYAYLKISEGCNNYCTYCTIPKIRGKYQSFSLKNILQQAEKYLASGATELILVAEDTTAWGTDLFNKPSLEILLNELVKLSKLKWLRIMYTNPKFITKDLINTIKKEQKICKYLDMPIQHVNNRILKDMNRNYTQEYLKELIKTLKSEIPSLVLRTSLIVGFPGENNTEFSELKKFITEYPFEQLGCFLYAQEKDTIAGKREDQIPQNIKEKRKEVIMLTQQQMLPKINQKFINQELEIIYEGNNNARSYINAPEIDNNIILQNTKNLTLFNYFRAKILGLNGYDFYAQILNK